MSAKQLMPNQHVPLHFLYSRDDCCLCSHQVTVGNLERQLETIREYVSNVDSSSEGAEGIALDVLDILEGKVR